MNETIGSRIAKFRKLKNMTQEDLAQLMGVSSRAVSKWENDLSCPDIQSVPTLCGVLGITADELLSGKKEEVRLLPEAQRKSLDELTLRIRVKSAQGDKVKVNLPMSLVKVCLEVGVDITPNMPGFQGMDGIRNLDLNKIMELAERGMIGKIVEIESAGGDTAEVVVE